MQIIVNHLTRMQAGYICVAGIDVANGRHIRPVLRGRLTTNFLARKGGPFDIAARVDLGRVEYAGQAPEVEDYYFNHLDVRNIGTLSSEQFWKQLQDVAQSSITELFGSEIKAYKNGCVVEVGTGTASLGCLLPAAPPRLFVNNYGGIRAVVTDGNFTVDLSVTDIRFCEIDHKTPKEQLIKQVNKRMQDGQPVILSVGLTRPWKQKDETVERHWLQVNNIHFECIY
jgi:hypothetical protein